MSALLEDYFPQALAKLVELAAYIKPQIELQKYERTVIDSTGRIWQGSNDNSMKKLQGLLPVQSLADINTDFITLDGNLARLIAGVLIPLEPAIDLIPVDNIDGGIFGTHYVTSTGQLYSRLTDELTETPEPIVQIAAGFLKVYLLTVSGRTIIFKLDNGTIIFTDNTTDTVKIHLYRGRGNLECLQLKIDGSFRIMSHDGTIRSLILSIPEEFYRVIDFAIYQNTIVVVNMFNKLAIVYEDSSSPSEILPGYVVSFGIEYGLVSIVTKEGRIMYREADSDVFVTIPRVKLLY